VLTLPSEPPDDYPLPALSDLYLPATRVGPLAGYVNDPSATERGAELRRLCRREIAGIHGAGGDHGGGVADVAGELVALAGYRFDLSTEIPIRAQIYSVGPEQYVVGIVVHHIAFDGWSMAPMFADMG
jgi:hypothetical protein